MISLQDPRMRCGMGTLCAPTLRPAYLSTARTGLLHAAQDNHPNARRCVRLHSLQLAAHLSERDVQMLKIEQLTYEMATLERWRFARRSERLVAVQRSLLDESIDTDLEAISLEIE